MRALGRLVEWRACANVSTRNTMTCSCGGDHLGIGGVGMNRSGGLSRRGAMIGAGALGVASLAGVGRAAATPHRIDVHHHFLPPQYLQEAPAVADVQRVYAWSPERTLDEMDRNGVAASMLSFPTPSLWFPGAEPARRLARLCNDYSAGLVRDHPTRFGLFAGLPTLQDTVGCLHEIAYAYDTLKTDGVAVMTSYEGRYLGDALFAPVWEELNRRKAVVFVHPTNPECCTAIPNGVPPGFGEYPFDTARTVMSLWTGEALQKWPDLRFIFSHGGGGLPMIADRIDYFGRPQPDGKPPIHDALAFIKLLYFDTANAAGPAALAATRALADPTHILFGTDYPYVPTRRNADYLTQARLTPAERRGIERGNALTLLAGLRSRL